MNHIMLTKQIAKYLLTIFLIPMSFIWDYVYRIRRFLYNYGLLKRNSYKVPIISVGNLTFGGTGKTPFVIWLSKYLDTMEQKVMILMRGYKGKLESSSGILRSSSRLGHSPLEFGDEALLLSRKLKKAAIVVGKKRSQNLEKFFHDEKPDVIVLDDGHQHLKLSRNLNIVLFDALMPVGKYHVAPWGYLREGFSALADADIVLIGRTDQTTRMQVNSLKTLIKSNMYKKVPFGEIGYKPTGIYNSNFEKNIELNELKNRKVICVTGIASPVSFFKLVQGFEVQMVDKLIFPDHHDYNSNEIRSIVEKAKKEDCLILTTEKDMVKIKRLKLSENFFFLEIQMYFISGEQEVKDKINNVLLVN